MKIQATEPSKVPLRTYFVLRFIWKYKVKGLQKNLRNKAKIKKMQKRRYGNNRETRRARKRQKAETQ